MSEETDIASMAELEDKITQRIREQIRMMAEGYEHPLGSLPRALCGPAASYTTLVLNTRMQLLNDQSFITELTKRIGQRMNQIY